MSDDRLDADDLVLKPLDLIGQTVEGVIIGEYGNPEVIHFGQCTMLIGCSLAGENVTLVYHRLKVCPACDGKRPFWEPCDTCIWGLRGWVLADNGNT
jgi:hypothetical protein